MDTRSETNVHGHSTALLARCLAPVFGARAAPDLADLSRFEADDLLQSIERHRVAGLAWRALASAETLPADFRSALAATAQTNAKRSLARASELIRIHDAARAAGIDLLPLKGTVLSQQLHADPGVRVSRDIDLLVPEDALTAARTCLVELGYLQVKPSFGEGDARWPLYCRFEHNAEFRSATAPCLLEVHWRLHPVASLMPIDCRALLDRGGEIEIGGQRLPCMSRPDTLLYLCAHGARHNWRRLKWLCDLPPLLQAFAPDDIRMAREAIARSGLHRCVAQGLALCRTLWPESLPAWSDELAPAAGRPMRILIKHAHAARVAYPDERTMGRLSTRENLANLRAGCLLKASPVYKWHRLRLLLLNADALEHTPFSGRMAYLTFLLRPWIWLKRRFSSVKVR